MVINNTKLPAVDILNPYRRGMDAPTYSEPVPREAVEVAKKRANSWGRVARKVRHIPTGVVYDSAAEAARETGYGLSTVRCACAPSQRGKAVFEWANEGKALTEKA